MNKLFMGSGGNFFCICTFFFSLTQKQNQGAMLIYSFFVLELYMFSRHSFTLIISMISHLHWTQYNTITCYFFFFYNGSKQQALLWVTHVIFNRLLIFFSFSILTLYSRVSMNQLSLLCQSTHTLRFYQLVGTYMKIKYSKSKYPKI